MEIACVIDCRLAAPERPGHSGGLRLGRELFDDPGADRGEDPVEAAELTEAVARALEGIGAAVESERAGEAFFAVDGLRGLYGGERRGVVAAARRAAGRRCGSGWRRPGSPPSPPPSAARWSCRGAARTLPRAAARRRCWSSGSASARRGAGRDAGAARDRHAGGARGASPRPGRRPLRAARAARAAPRPRRRGAAAPARPHEELAEEIELPEGTAGRPARAGPRAARRPLPRRPAAQGTDACSALRLGARCSATAAAGASSRAWAGRPPRRGSCARCWRRGWRRCPARRASLRLRALGLGPPAGDQLELAVGGVRARAAAGSATAVREVRAAQGAEALLKVLPVDPASRVPERRAVLTPYPP